MHFNLYECLRKFSNFQKYRFFKILKFLENIIFFNYSNYHISLHAYKTNRDSGYHNCILTLLWLFCKILPKYSILFRKYSKIYSLRIKLSELFLRIFSFNIKYQDFQKKKHHTFSNKKLKFWNFEKCGSNETYFLCLFALLWTIML